MATTQEILSALRAVKPELRAVFKVCEIGVNLTISNPAAFNMKTQSPASFDGRRGSFMRMQPGKTNTTGHGLIQ